MIFNLQKIKDFLFRREWTPIETLRFSFFDVTFSVQLNYSATFYMDKNGERKVDIDGDLNSASIMPPKNHPFYHNIVVPFIRKTGPFVDKDKSFATIKLLAEQEKFLTVQMLKEKMFDFGMDKVTLESKDNVITFPINPDHEKTE